MAVPPSKSRGDEFEQPIALLRPAPRRKIRDIAVPVLVTGAVFLVCLAVVHYVLPEALPAVWQRLTGLVCAGVVLAAFLLATRQTETDEEFIHRIRSGQHSDFGKRLRQNQPKPITLKVPLLGERSARSLIAGGLFVVLSGWWLTPWAPIGVQKPAVVDLTGPLIEEIVSVALIMPSPSVATLQPPTPSRAARQLAATIKFEDNAFHRGLQAIAQRRFDDARTLLALAMRNDDAPPPRIRLARALNEMYAGQFADATGWYDEAMLDSPDDPMLLCQLAVAWLQAYEFDKAEPLVYEAARACLEKPVEQRGAALGVCFHLQAVLCIGQGKGYQESETKCRQARDIFQKAYGQQHPLVAASLNNHAVLYLMQAKYPGAKGLVEQAHNIWSRAMGSNDPRLLASLGNLAMQQCAVAQYADAAETLDRALAVQPPDIPEDDPILAITHNELAVLEHVQGRYGEAQSSAEKALASCEKGLGTEHPNVAVIVDTAATIYNDQAKHAKAGLYLLRAANLAEQDWGPDHPYLAGVQDDLALYYLQEGRPADAQPLCEQALETTRKALGEKHPGFADALSVCGKLEVARGDLRKARAYFEQALAIRKEALGEDHPAVARAMGNLASLYLHSSSYPQGVALYQRAIEMTDHGLGLDHPQVAWLLCGLASLYTEHDMYTEAEPCLKRALAVRESTLVPFHPDLADTLDTYAEVLLKLAKPDADRAAAMKDRAASIRERHREEDQVK